MTTKASTQNLTRRAMLTLVSNVLEQIANLSVALLITPLIIEELGAELYGAWLIIQTATGYVAMADLRPMGTLKFTLAVEQHDENYGKKRRQVGASLIVWAGTQPLILSAGAVFVLLTPQFVRVSPDLMPAVQLAAIIVVLRVALANILSLPSNVLRGVNLDYKAMGSNALSLAVGGLMGAGAVMLGFGLPGLAAAGIASIALNSLIRLIVARRNVPWFGIARPTRAEVFRFANLSGWLLFSTFSLLLMNSSDLILIGIFFDPTVAAIYGITGAVMRMLLAPLRKFLTAGAPGIAGLCGQQAWKRVERVRTEIHILALALMIVAGAGVIALNREFLRLWVGAEFYGGDVLNALLVFAGISELFFNADAIIVDSMLLFKQKSLAMLLSGIGSIVLAVALIQPLGAAAIALAIVVGRLGLIAYLARLIARKTGISAARKLVPLLRLSATGLVIIAAAWAMNHALAVTGWPTFFISSTVIGGVAGLIVWFVGLDQTARQMLRQRFSTILTYPILSTLRRVRHAE
jgi:O-antigen/teichoic acid export membrane protein